MQFTIRADWDNEAEVWVAIHDDLGLAIEAESLDKLQARIQVIVPELIEANSLQTDGVPFDLLVHNKQQSLACA